MAKNFGLGDTIAAISTSSGMGGIGIIRLSGPDSLAIADQMFIARKKTKLASVESFTVHYGDVVRTSGSQAEVVDEALVTVMRAPRSYTCEDVVEISCHGGSAVTKMVLETALQLGARLAEPGEFTKRAFLNGRIDLTQAEAVLDVIKAKTASGVALSELQLKGELTTKIEEIRERLLNTHVNVEGFLNFPEEGDEGPVFKDVLSSLMAAGDKMRFLLRTADQGRILREGIKIVLCGKPNVGKSSLLNVLLGHPRAIVSPIEGTTRDTIEEHAQIGDVPFQIVDTAGIIEPRNEIEEEAVRRSHLYIEEADLVLFLIDGHAELSDADDLLARKLEGRDVLVVLNKIDLENKVDQKRIQHFFPGKDCQRISVLNGEGIDALREKILNKVFYGQRLESRDVLLSNIRHIDALKKASAEVFFALEAVEKNYSVEFVAEHIKHAIEQLDCITGRNADIDLVEQIFSNFCVGK